MNLNEASTQLYDSLLGGFIWSHILLQEIDNFLAAIHRYVTPGGTVVFIDNNYVQGSNLPIALTDAEGNTYQNRQLRDGSIYLVLKNFPSEGYLRRKLEGVGREVTIINITYYRILVYKRLPANK